MRDGNATRVVAVLIGSVAFAVAGGAATSTHTVRRGDTVGAIALGHKVPAAAVVAANDLADPDHVRAGTTLRIPDRAAAAVAKAVPISKRSPNQDYVVRAGDTLSSIARKFTTTVAMLVAENDLGTPSASLRAGARLEVPRRKGTEPSGPLCPVKGAGKFDFSNSFGAPREGRRRHGGNDIFARRGTPVFASVAGTIRPVTGANVGIGYYLDGDDGVTYYGAHLAALSAREGPVERGQVIGAVGATGNARGTPPHLHFEVKPGDGAPVDPYGLLRKWCR